MAKAAQVMVIESDNHRLTFCQPAKASDDFRNPPVISRILKESLRMGKSIRQRPKNIEFNYLKNVVEDLNESIETKDEFYFHDWNNSMVQNEKNL